MQITTRSIRNNHRHSLWYERIFLSFRTHYFLGLLPAVVLPALWQWGWSVWTLQANDAINTLLASAAAYMVALKVVQRLSRYPGVNAFYYVVPAITLSYLAILMLLELTETAFALGQLITSYIVALMITCTGYLVAGRYRRPKMAIVPLGDIREWPGAASIDRRWLERPSLDHMRVDGIVVDLSADLDAEWQRFLADCTIRRIPVYDARRLGEALTGRIGLDHLHANRYSLLMPRTNYEMLKRIMDVVAVLMVLPAALPIMGIAAFMIKRDDPGPAIFRQKRSGFQGVEFDVYKLRSMYVSQDNMRPTAEGDDPRITRIGKYLRKYRIDELPQLFNVLKGDMSLIGPRPETPALTHAYERDIPFFRYRHVVRPGISGWAQVEQGYASEVEGSRTKLEYDFYYIRHFSFWMDLLIVIRTIKTIFTGSGAR